jgi:host cell surface-exposed lipoprotein
MKKTIASILLAGAAMFGVTACYGPTDFPPEGTVQGPVYDEGDQLPEPEREAEQPAEPKVPVEEQQAVASAESYLDTMAFSRDGLVEQLEFEGFPKDTAARAVDSMRVDWNEQAEKSAADYLDTMAFSHDGLVEQLVFEGFTQKQAEHGASSVGL